jgi:hypothetical protein
MTRKPVDYEFEMIYGGYVAIYSKYYPVVCQKVIYKAIKKSRDPGYAHTDTNLKLYTL